MWKRVAYLDETHNAESYWICGVVVDVNQVRSAQAGLAGVAEKAETACELSGLPELHGHDLWQGAGDFAGVPPRLRVGIYADALDVLAGLESAVVIRGVRRKKIRYLDPHRLAWRYAIESIDERGGEGPILIVADEHAATEHALRGDIQTYISGSTGGWKPRTITNVLPELRFLDSRDNALLQGADLIAFLHQRRFNVATESDDRSQKAREMLWQKVAPYVAWNIWDPPY